jgi:hypothetical protein
MEFTFNLNPISQIVDERGLETGGRTQKYIDGEVMRYMAPYMPFDTGSLIQSMINGTDVGSGIVSVNSPYAHYLHENPQFNFQGSPMRGGQFFPRMKADHKEDVLKGARRISGAD